MSLSLLLNRHLTGSQQWLCSCLSATDMVNLSGTHTFRRFEMVRSLRVTCRTQQVMVPFNTSLTSVSLSWTERESAKAFRRLQNKTTFLRRFVPRWCLSLETVPSEKTHSLRRTKLARVVLALEYSKTVARRAYSQGQFMQQTVTKSLSVQSKHCKPELYSPQTVADVRRGILERSREGCGGCFCNIPQIVPLPPAKRTHYLPGLSPATLAR